MATIRTIDTPLDDGCILTGYDVSPIEDLEVLLTLEFVTSEVAQRADRKHLLRMIISPENTQELAEELLKVVEGLRHVSDISEET